MRRAALAQAVGLAGWLAAVFAAAAVGAVAGSASLRLALVLFALQLCANALWSWLFFAWNDGALAFAKVLVLWGLIAATIAAFWRISRLAGALMLPYLAWVTLACALTWSIWQNNPGLL